MQRFIATITLTAFLLVITMPMLPIAPACAHTAMATNANDDTCEMACHDESPEIMPDDMNMSDLDMHTTSPKQTQELAKEDNVSEKPPYCRIECGCGCNNKPDTFPLTLSPHLPSIILVAIKNLPSEQALSKVSINITRHTPPESPPPRTS